MLEFSLRLLDGSRHSPVWLSISLRYLLSFLSLVQTIKFVCVEARFNHSNDSKLHFCFSFHIVGSSYNFLNRLFAENELLYIYLPAISMYVLNVLPYSGLYFPLTWLWPMFRMFSDDFVSELYIMFCFFKHFQLTWKISYRKLQTLECFIWFCPHFTSAKLFNCPFIGQTIYVFN